MDCSIIGDMLLAYVDVSHGRSCSRARGGNASRIREQPPVVAAVSLEDGPGRSHQFVREGDGHHVGMGSGFEIREPSSQAVRPLTMMTADGAGPMNEQAPKVPCHRETIAS